MKHIHNIQMGSTKFWAGFGVQHWTKNNFILINKEPNIRQTCAKRDKISNEEKGMHDVASLLRIVTLSFWLNLLLNISTRPD